MTNFNTVCHRAAKEAMDSNLHEANKSLPQVNKIQPTSKTVLRLVVSESSSKEFAAKLGVSETTISQWLAGTKNIPELHQLAILRESKMFIKIQMRKMLEIDDYIDALEIMSFGVRRG